LAASIVQIRGEVVTRIREDQQDKWTVIDPSRIGLNTAGLSVAGIPTTTGSAASMLNSGFSQRVAALARFPAMRPAAATGQ
jgi:arginine/lysine/ornithine decarboxylase